MKVMLDLFADGDEIVRFHCTERFQDMVRWHSRSLEGSVSVYQTDETPTVGDGFVVLTAEKIRCLFAAQPGLGILVCPPKDNSAFLIAEGVPSGLSQADLAFVDTAKSVSSELGMLARTLIDGTRRLQPKGTLKSGTGKRLTNSPDNFVAFTVQTREKAILVNVRATPASRAAKIVDVMPDRRPYVRFKVRTAEEAVEGSELILASWKR